MADVRYNWSEMIALWERLDRARRQDGFTFTELAVALAVLGVAMLLLTTLIANNLRGVLHGKQRAAANAVGQQVLEQARSTSYEQLGHLDTDLDPVDDPQIVTDSNGVPWTETNAGTGCPDPGFVSPPPAGSGCERLVVVSNAVPPFDEHISPDFSSTSPPPIERGSTTLRHWIYVTGADQDADGVPDDLDSDGQVDLKRVTVRVAWDNPGVAGAENQIRMETLIDTSRVAPPQHIAGSAFVKNGSLSLTTDLNGSVDGLGHALPITDVSSDSIPSLNAVSCLARAGVITPTGDTSYGPTGVTAVADDDSTTTNILKTAVDSHTFTDPAPSGVQDWLEDPSNDFPGAMRCFSSVEQVDPDPAAPTPTGYPYGRGTATNSSAPALTYEQDVDIPELAIPDLLGGDDIPLFGGGEIEVAQVNAYPAAGTTDAEGILDTGPTTDELTATATQFQGEVRFITAEAEVDLLSGVGSVIGSLVFNPDVGLVRVQPYNVSAEANGIRGTGDPAADGSSSVTSAVVEIWVYDPDLNPVGESHVFPDSTCTGGRQSPSGTGDDDYCVIRFDPDTDGSFTASGGASFGLGVSAAGSIAASAGARLYYSVSLSGSSSAPPPTVGPEKATWRAQANPLTGNVQLCVTTGSGCEDETGTTYLHHAAEFDLGTIVAEVVGSLA